MNNLVVFSNEVIPVYMTDKGEKVVIGRELHEKLRIEEKYTQWFDRMCGYGFVDSEDYTSYWKADDSDPIFGNAHFKSPQQAAALGYQRNHLLKLDMAKHIAMIQRTPEGKAIRDKLIALETNVSELSPELRLLINMELQQKQQAKELESINSRLDETCQLIALNPVAWRSETRDIIIKIAQKLGGNEYIQEVHREIFKLVDARGGVSLETRLTNKRRRMAEEGKCKSARDKTTKVDVIADDKKLIEIYLAIVKEMAIKHGVGLHT